VSLKPGFVPHYRMALAGLGLETFDTDAPRTAVNTGFLQFLLGEWARALPFDAGFYLETNPDVAPLIARGGYADAQDHFVRCGFAEGRLPQRLAFDAPFYAANNRDLAVLEPGGAVALAAHFLQFGRFEGRIAHPEAEAEARRWARAVARSHSPFAHRTIEGALIQAFRPPLVGARGRGFRGGLVLSDDPADLPLRHRRGGLAIDSFPPSDTPVGALAGAFVYGGPYCDPFGHAMAEMIHRVLPARSLFDCRRLLFVGAGTDHVIRGFGGLPVVMRSALQFLDVAPGDVTVIRDNRVVEHLHVVEQGSDLAGGPSEAYLQLLAAFTPRRLDELVDGGERAEKVYVSRSRIAHGGLLLGERYLESLLEREGWRILHPQDWALVAQMQAYRGAKVVMFAEGSACHGVELFGTGGLAHCILLPRRTSNQHVFDSTLAPRAQRYDVLPAADLLGTVVTDPQSGMALDHMGVSVLPLDALVTALRELGVAHLPRVSLATYRRAARADLNAYLTYHRETADAADVAAIRARCATALGRE
jgi:hypothetical protein